MILAPSSTPKEVHLHHKQHHRHHPAWGFYVATIVLLGFVVLFGFISVFVPWAMKDIAPGQRAWAFPFKTCIENTFSNVNEETCIDNDFIEPVGGVPLTGKNEECKAYILATIAFVFISVIPGVIALILIAYMLEHLWWRPYIVAIITQAILVLVCISCFLAWIFFIVYAEMVCAEDSIFPVRGYSYGFILYMFATPMAIAAVVTGAFGLNRVRKSTAEPENVENEVMLQPAPFYAEYPAFQPSTLPVWPEPQSYPVQSSSPVPVFPASYPEGSYPLGSYPMGSYPQASYPAMTSSPYGMNFPPPPVPLIPML